ncbi:MAG TPA: hypothetical protein VFG46_15970, partial [Chryseolinea sp.]|nr:hypothetical protein [Chryseolinea sp.]
MKFKFSFSFINGTQNFGQVEFNKISAGCFVHPEMHFSIPEKHQLDMGWLKRFNPTWTFFS